MQCSNFKFSFGKSIASDITTQAPNSEQKKSQADAESAEFETELEELISKASSSQIVSKKRSRQQRDGIHTSFREWCEQNRRDSTLCYRLKNDSGNRLVKKFRKV